MRKIVQDSEEYELAKKGAIANLKVGFHLGGKINASREELRAIVYAVPLWRVYIKR